MLKSVLQQTGLTAFALLVTELLAYQHLIILGTAAPLET